MTDRTNALNLLRDNNFADITTDKQKKENRIMVEDVLTNDRYTLSPETGWVRIYPNKCRKVVYTYFGPRPALYWHTYQLNRKDRSGNRIKIHNFMDMANIVVSVNNKRLKKYYQ